LRFFCLVRAQSNRADIANGVRVSKNLLVSVPRLVRWQNLPGRIQLYLSGIFEQIAEGGYKIFVTLHIPIELLAFKLGAQTLSTPLFVIIASDTTGDLGKISYRLATGRFRAVFFDHPCKYNFVTHR
jgi:hypothetical protein